MKYKIILSITYLINYSDICQIIGELKDDAPVGFNIVTANLLKHIDKYVLKPLTYLYNLSIQKSICPEKF